MEVYLRLYHEIQRKTEFGPYRVKLAGNKIIIAVIGTNGSKIPFTPKGGSF